MKVFRNVTEKIVDGVSIKFVLIIPMFILIIILTGFIGWTSYKTGSAAITDLIKRVSSDMTNEVELAIQKYFSDTDVVLNSFAPDVQGGGLAAFNYQDNDAIEQRLWELTKVSPDVVYVYMGKPNGDFIGVDRGTTKNVYIKRRDAVNKERTTFIATKPGDRSNVKQVDAGFDTVNRPWYKKTIETGAHAWAPLFVSWSRNMFIITRSKPVKDINGNFLGVVTTDKPLDRLSGFLDQVKKNNLSPNSEAFIIEKNGDLVASTADPQPYIKGEVKDSFSRVKSTASKSEIIKAAGRYLEKNESVLADGEPKNILLNAKKNKIHMALKKLSGIDGLDWYIVVLAPESDFNQKIIAEAKQTLYYSLGMLALVLVLALSFLHYSLKDLTLLTDASKKFAYGEKPESLPVTRNDEIGVLARTFKDMVMEILRQKDELMKYNNELETRVAQRTKDLASKNNQLLVEIKNNKLAQQKILQLFSALEMSDEAIAVYGPDKTVKFVNPAFMKMTGYSMEDMREESMNLLAPGRFNEEKFTTEAANEIDTQLNSGKPYRGVVQARKKDGILYYCDMSITPIFDKETNNLIAYNLLERDVTQNEKIKADMLVKLRTDKLTELLNREALVRDVDEKFINADGGQNSFAVLYMDLNKFKHVNDTLGHDFGDATLIVAGQRMKSCIGPEDLLARIGGDEFVAVVKNVKTREEAVQVGLKIENNIKQPMIIKDKRIEIGTAFGVAIYPKDGSNLDSLLKAADTEMYSAKRASRGSRAA